MFKTFKQLLGEDIPVFRRYIFMAIAYGLCCGLAITAVLPIISCLLTGELEQSALWLAIVLAGAVVCWMLRYRVEQAGIKVGGSLLQGGRHRLGDHIARLPVGWFTSQNSAQLGHIVTVGMMSVAQVPAHVLTPVISGVVTSVVFMIALFTIHWVLGLIALLALPLLVTVMVFTARLSRQADEAFQQSFVDVSQRVVEFAQSQSVLRCFNGNGGSMRFLEQSFEQQRQSSMNLIWRSAVAAVLNVWTVQVVFATLFFVATLLVNSHIGNTMATAEVIGTVVSLLLVVRFIEPLLEVVGYAGVLRGVRGQLHEISELLAVRPLPEPTSPQLPGDTSIALHNVHFRYAPDAPEVLHNVNLHIAPGSMTALIGESGSGKTTLAQLLARFLDVNRGRVLVGGVDVRQISYTQLSNQISQIFQNNYLFEGTIADNIRIGKPTAGDAEIEEVAKLAGVSEMLRRLPQGLMTPVGEGGARLSGGERQRIAIARALLKNAPILLVDEATAAMDAENQSVIAETLARLRGKCTLVVIAHQLSTIATADQIVVLESGRIVEQGSPAQLQQKQGRYAQFLEQRRVAKGWRIETETSSEASS